MTQPQPKKSDLPVRAASAMVMVAVAGTALWLGGWWWTVFVAAVGVGIAVEFWGLVRGFVRTPLGQIAWLVGAVIYIGSAVLMLMILRDRPPVGWIVLLLAILGVIGTDVGAYFTGRALGGPKIAPKISPSKTWSGLGGGMLGASLVIYMALTLNRYLVDRLLITHSEVGASASVDILLPSFGACLLIGATLAVVAQCGDFFESWMKRRAGVKDSSKIIPGHGGLFDRADGMIAVLFVLGLFSLHDIFFRP